MTMTKHTQGPWHITGNKTKYIEARIRDGWLQEVASVGPTESDNGYGPQQEANARLIAAAPELLEALQEILAIDGHSSLTREDSDKLDAKARAAIAKATGEQL
jgi:hypothetical protein